MPIDCGGFAESADLVAADDRTACRSSRATDFSTSAPAAAFLAAVAARLAERVVTIDRYKTLVQLAQQRFAHLGVGNVVARQADGLKRH